MSRILLSVLCLTLFTALTSSELLAQGTIIEELTARQLGDGIIVRWKIGQGNSCIDMNIERSTDSVNYLKIGEYRGLCGSNDSDTHYEWFDNAELNVNSGYWYRINASNGTVVSKPASVQFRDSNAGAVSIVPNPMISSSVIYYANTTGDKVQLLLFDMSGRLLYRSEKSAANQFNIDNSYGRTGNLLPGTYLVKILSEGQVKASEKLQVN